mgnify:CR=1 FL=1
MEQYLPTIFALGGVIVGAVIANIAIYLYMK